MCGGHSDTHTRSLFAVNRARVIDDDDDDAPVFAAVQLVALWNAVENANVRPVSIPCGSSHGPTFVWFALSNDFRWDSAWFRRLFMLIIYRT